MLALATLPSPVRALYLRTDDKLKPKLDARINAIAALETSPRSQWKHVASQLSTIYKARFGRGFSTKRLLDLFRDYREVGPEALMLGYGSDGEKPTEFINFLARRVEDNNRVASVELDAIRAEWLAGQQIPGYGTWGEKWKIDFGEDEPLPETCPVWFIPEGWHPRNLRRYLPGDATLTLARDGFFAAHGKMPQKGNDYSEVLPLQYVVFDDVKTDWLVHYPGCSSPCELWLLVAMDLATRTILDWVALAAVPNDEGKRASLLEQHMKLLGGSLLTRYGIPTTHRMTWIVENAKATFRDAAKAALKTLSGDQVAVENMKMVTRKLPGGYFERHGTPWYVKGVLESFFRTFHDHGASLPGQTGSIQMLNAPAELAGRQKEHEQLVKECADLPLAIQEQLKLPFLRYSEAIVTLENLFAHLNGRTNHRLQGFDRMELWRFPSDTAWRPIDELRRYPASDVRLAKFHWRMESPLERMEKLLRRQDPFTRVPPESLLGFSARLVKRVRHPAPFTISFTEQGTEWVYRGEVPELASGDGGPFVLKLLPGDMSIAYLHDADTGALLGTLAHVARPRFGHEEEQKAALGELQHVRSLVIKPLMDRQAPKRAERAENKRLNEALIASARAGAGMIADAAAAKKSARKQSAADQQRNVRRSQQLAALAQNQNSEPTPI